MSVECIQIDYTNPTHAHDLVTLLDNYAADPMGGAEPLAQSTKDRLAAELASRPFAFSVIAYVDGQAAGLANCFEAFSTFKCKPLINIHDLAVSLEFRGRGISQLLLQKIEDIANKKGCCKLTLEVLDGNNIAQQAYLKYGFAGYELDPKLGQAKFWQKAL